MTSVTGSPSMLDGKRVLSVSSGGRLGATGLVGSSVGKSSHSCPVRAIGVRVTPTGVAVAPPGEGVAVGAAVGAAVGVTVGAGDGLGVGGAPLQAASRATTRT